MPYDRHSSKEHVMPRPNPFTGAALLRGIVADAKSAAKANRLRCGHREGVSSTCSSRATVTITDDHGVEHRCTKHARTWIDASCRYAVSIVVTAVDPEHASAAVLKLVTK